ncbi:MAG TPA: hypothetical protein VJQ44_05995 [Gemmatimonadales bacterium]|nr:hypothetical protein [Gemmatimonadales bacterium]
MKARHLSTSFATIYALGLLDQVRVIRRGPDGFWGPWAATGSNAKRLVQAGPVTAVIGVDDRVAIYDQLPGRARHTWDFQASDLSAAGLSRGGSVLLASAGGRVWGTERDSALAPWTRWVPLGGPVDGLVVAATPKGALTVCARVDGEVHCLSRPERSATWSAWESLGSPGGGAEDLALVVMSRGGMAVFAIGRDGAVHHRWQDRPGSPWNEWVSLGGLARSLSVTRTASGGLALFITGHAGRVGTRYQSRPFGRWTPWFDLHGDARAVFAQQSYTEGLEAFVLGTDDEVRHAWCARLGTPWTEWQLLEREFAGLRLDSPQERALPAG